MNVSLLAASPGRERPDVLGSGRSRGGGAFSIHYRRAPRSAVKYLVATRPGGAAEAGFPVPASAYRLAAALGAGRVPRRATVNERTTVAIGYSMAQFIAGSRIAGKNPGLRNAAAMARNLVSRGSGNLSPVLSRFPNGRTTSTLPTFDSLANLLTVCRRQTRRCAQLLRLGGVPGGGPVDDTLRATVEIARNPWHNVEGLYRLSRVARRLYRPALGGGEQPDAWTLALRFEGVPRTMDGPGQFAIDGGGSLWVANNYEYSRKPKAVCGAQNLLRFTPTGRGYPGSPYEGGGLSGAGFGIGIDPENHVWVGNFGFEAPTCRRRSPHNSVSEFTLAGKALSPDLEKVLTPQGLTFRGGYEQGNISWPQGTVSDRRGNIWIANCGNNSVTKYASGDPEAATNLGPGLTHLEKPFGVAVNGRGTTFVTGNESSNVAILGPNGAPAANSPVHGGGLHRPMGVAVDANGYAWVANSGKVPAPCPFEFNLIPGRGSAVLLKPNGELATSRPIRGGGIATPWGVAIDGDNQVWFANFTGRRLSELCGTSPQLCPPGKRQTGAAISPDRTGYGFDGLVRSTAVAIDPSGNVWMTNNWKTVAAHANPGGYQIVAYLGLAAPIHTPLIGPPEQP
jgi:hypothetical protein